MNPQQYLRTNFIPFNPAHIRNNSTKPQNHHGQTTQTSRPSHSQSHIHQNVTIGNGMMTVRIPISQFNQLMSTHAPVGTLLPTSTSIPLPSSGPVLVSTPVSAPIPAATRQVHHAIPSVPTTSHKAVVPDWDSAGVILIDNEYHSKTGATYQTIFLGHNPHSGKHELFYGKRNASDIDPTETAIRECMEETANMFHLSKSMFDSSFSVKSTNKKHHAYVVRVQPPKFGIQSKVFYQNLTTLQAAGAPHCWRELSGITRIGIKEAISSGLLVHPNGSDFVIFDVYGNPITISSRDAEFIRDAIKAKMNVYAPVRSLRFIQSYDDKFEGNTKRYINTTGCYMC
jgi:hypothetical protein